MPHKVGTDSILILLHFSLNKLEQWIWYSASYARYVLPPKRRT